MNSHGSITGFRQTGSGYVSTGSSFARPVVPGFLRPRYSDSYHAECEGVFCFDSVSIAGAHDHRDEAISATVAIGPLSCLYVTLVYCGQTVDWIKMPLGTEVGLGPGDIVLDGNPATPTERGIAAPPLTFRPTALARSPTSATVLSSCIVFYCVLHRVRTRCICLLCKVKKSNRIYQFAIRHTATGTHMPYGITQCYLPPGRGGIPACVIKLS